MIIYSTRTNQWLLYRIKMDLARGGQYFMPTILVDYENVNGSNGLKGTDVLCRDDTLIIFYSKNCGKIRYDYIQEIKESGCEFRVIK